MSDEYDDEFEDLIEALDKVSGAIKSAREYTHTVLGHAYAVLVRVKRDKPMQAELLELYKEAGHRDQKNTDDAMRIIKLRITGDRKAAQPFAARLRDATKENVSLADFPVWLEKHGIYPKDDTTKKQTEEQKKKNEEAKDNQWHAGCQAVAKLPPRGTIDLPDGLPTDNIMVLLVVRKVSGDKTVKLVEAYAGDTDPVVGPLIRKYGRSK